MIERSVFYARLATCKPCPFWKGACLKGHVLQGTLGCPIKKFAGIEGVGYMEDLPVPTPEMPEAGGCATCGATDGDLAPMTWPEVVRHLMEAGKKWREAGYPLTPDKAYVERINTCKTCSKGQYKWFQCRHCKCLIYTKAKLASEDCPYGLWPKLS
jgi:hypothetical protein